MQQKTVFGDVTESNFVQYISAEAKNGCELSCVDKEGWRVVRRSGRLVNRSFIARVTCSAD